MSRISRPIIDEARYFITSVTHKRKTWFSKPNLAQIVVEQWRHYESAYDFLIHAYCVMPDHYHVVLDVGKIKTISQIVHAVNSYVVTAMSTKLQRDRKIKIWSGEPWDEVIRNEDMYWQKVANVLFNPWRAKLVTEPLETYSFSNIDEWFHDKGEEFLSDLFSRYRRWYE